MTTTIKVPAGKHSDTGASGASRWMNCPGSVRLIKKLGKKARTAGHEAAYGTAAHTLSALCITRGEEPWEYAGVEIEVEDRYRFMVEEEMINSSQVYVDFVNDQMAKYKDQKPILHVERSMQSNLHHDAYGQADITIEVPNERLIIADFKNGMVPVEVKGPQTKFYGSLALEDLKGGTQVDTVETYIIQPRAMHHHGPIRKAHYKPAELTDWFKGEVVPAIDATKDKNAHLVIGEQCRWCDARDHCPAIKSELMHFNTDVDPVFLTDEELSLQMRRGEVIAKYIDGFLKEETFNRIKGGTPVKGYKLVEKQSKRVFKDKMTNEHGLVVKFDAAVRGTFGNNAFDSKVKSPAQIEKMPGGKAFASKWAFKPKTGYTITDMASSKPEVKTVGDKYTEQQDEINA